MIGRAAVLMPAYNAAATVERVFERIPESARERIAHYVVVDDGSRDATAAVLERIACTTPGMEVIRHPRNRGYGGAIKTLLGRAVELGADAGIVLHADGQYSPEKIPELLAPLDAGTADIVQGSRMLGGGALKGGMPFYKYVSNKALTAVENAAFGLHLAEYHSGYMLYSRHAMNTIPWRNLSASFDFDLEMIVLAKVHGMRVAEVAIPTIYAGEKSHLNPVKYGFDVLGVVVAYLRGHYHRV
jgi:glycosyltransferase involved in cell wall biosynthesis